MFVQKETSCFLYIVQFYTIDVRRSGLFSKQYKLGVQFPDVCTFSSLACYKHATLLYHYILAGGSGHGIVAVPLPLVVSIRGRVRGDGRGERGEGGGREGGLDGEMFVLPAAYTRRRFSRQNLIFLAVQLL